MAKILNLYSGIGGNRKLWGEDHEITAVEIDENIAAIYQDYFPYDKVIITDAHEYLLKEFKNYDFIWSSPPCPTHSKARKLLAEKSWGLQNEPVFPDMKLYEEILLLQGYYKGKYCVENVKAWYKPLIPPQEREKHWFWANFVIAPLKTGDHRGHDESIKQLEINKGFDLSGYKGIDKRKVLRNCVEPLTALHVFNCAYNKQTQKALF